MLLVITLCFWVCLFEVAYTYAIYPVVIWLCARRFGRPKIEVTEPVQWPSVTFLMAAYNEADVIAETIRGVLNVDYPADRFEVVIGSDGSSDQTVAIATEVGGNRIRVFDYRQRRGKASVLNSSIEEITSEILVLSDANTQIDPQAVRSLLRWFGDPMVGAVCGRLVLTDPLTGSNADGLYWKYETFLKICEARLDALLGANGAIYAIRRDLYAPIPPGTIVDDFVIPLLAKQKTGCRILYESEAIAREETPADVSAEFHRRSRIGAGGFQSIGMLWQMLDPRRGWVAFAFLSHKLLRWFCPFFLIGLVISNLLLMLSGNPLYFGFMMAQVIFYSIAAFAALIPSRHRILKPLRLATMFTSMNAALLVGFFRWIRGSQKGVWKRTERLTNVEGVANQ